MEIDTKTRDTTWVYPAKYRMGPDYYPFTVSVTGRQTTKSPVTPWRQWREYKEYLESVGRGKGSNDPYYSLLQGMDYGGPFWSKSCTYSQSDPWYKTEGLVANSIVPLYFEGTPVPYAMAAGVNDGAWASDGFFETELSSVGVGMGTTAIARCQPTSPVANVSTFLGELARDGVPQAGSELLKNRIRSFKDLGSDYLNVEFGWRPFVADIRKFLYAIRDSHKILDQYERDSGKLIRRGYRFPLLETPLRTVVRGNTYAQPPMVPQFWDVSSASLYETHAYSRQYWFKGAFTYYLTRGDSTFGKMERWAQEADKLLGVKITPDVLWNLAPWSWFADWIFNFGDVISNVTAFSSDKLTMRYGYIMLDASYKQRYNMDGLRFSDHKPRDRVWQEFHTRVKTRQKATPYGFGLNPTLDFTARQWAILGALGMTQGPGLLKSM